MDQPTPNSNRILLAVLAHPDDESFGMGGTLALYAQQGVAVYLICATRGEMGDVAEEYLNGRKSVAEVREEELRCAAGILGLKQVIFLDYRDSGMPGSPDNQHPHALAAAPLEEVTGKIVHYIRLLQPQVVITFDPIGGYRHPDHIAVHLATVRAFHEAGDSTNVSSTLPAYQPQKLYFHTFSRRFLRWAVRLMPLFGKDPSRFGRNQDIDLASLACEDFPTHAHINYRKVEHLKDEASACHASQSGPISASPLMRLLFRVTGGSETFMRAFPPINGRLHERDLFEGVKLDIHLGQLSPDKVSLK